MRTDNDVFKEVIENYLKEESIKDPLFEKMFNREDKSIDECVKYIYSQVFNISSETERKGFADSEIYSMAKHYYIEDSIDINDKAIPSKIIVNQDVKLTEEEIAEAKSKALEREIDAQRALLTNKAKKKPEIKQDKVVEQASLF